MSVSSASELQLLASSPNDQEFITLLDDDDNDNDESLITSKYQQPLSEYDNDNDDDDDDDDGNEGSAALFFSSNAPPDRPFFGSSPSPRKPNPSLSTSSPSNKSKSKSTSTVINAKFKKLHDDHAKSKIKIQFQREENARLSVSGLFTPKLETTQLTSNLSETTTSGDFGERLHHTAEVNEKRRSVERSVNLTNVMREYTFQPQLVNSTKKVAKTEINIAEGEGSATASSSATANANEYANGNTVFTRNYQTAADIEVRRKILTDKISKEECSFKPEIIISPLKKKNMALAVKSVITGVTAGNISVSANGVVGGVDEGGKSLVARLYSPQHHQLMKVKNLQRQKEYEKLDYTYSPSINKTKSNHVAGVVISSPVSNSNGNRGGDEGRTLNFETPISTNEDEDPTDPSSTATPTAIATTAPQAKQTITQQLKSSSSQAHIRLHTHATQKSNSFELWRETQKKSEDSKECTFTPSLAPTKNHKINSPGGSGGGGRGEGVNGTSRDVEISEGGGVFERLARGAFTRRSDAYTPEFNYTFTPKLNPPSKMILKTPGESRLHVLSSIGSKKQNVRRSLPKDERVVWLKGVEEKEMEECTFLPRTEWRRGFRDRDRSSVGSVGERARSESDFGDADADDYGEEGEGEVGGTGGDYQNIEGGEIEIEGIKKGPTKSGNTGNTGNTAVNEDAHDDVFGIGQAFTNDVKIVDDVEPEIKSEKTVRISEPNAQVQTVNSNATIEGSEDGILYEDEIVEAPTLPERQIYTDEVTGEQYYLEEGEVVEEGGEEEQQQQQELITTSQAELPPPERPIYTDDVTGEQYYLEEEEIEIEVEGPIPAPVETETIETTNERKIYTDDVTGEQYYLEVEGEESSEPVVEEWEERYDEIKQYPYYYNRFTGMSVWEKPDSSVGGEYYEEQGEGEGEEVYDENRGGGA